MYNTEFTKVINVKGNTPDTNDLELAYPEYKGLQYKFKQCLRGVDPHLRAKSCESGVDRDYIGFGYLFKTSRGTYKDVFVIIWHIRKTTEYVIEKCDLSYYLYLCNMSLIIGTILLLYPHMIIVITICVFYCRAIKPYCKRHHVSMY